MMDWLLFATFHQSLWQADFWYAVPLIVALSLVYAATRHENLKAIFRHALRVAVMVVVFMAVIFVILWYFSSNL